MCNLLNCVYSGAAARQVVDVGIRKVIDLAIGRGTITELSGQGLGMEGRYDFDYLVYKGSGSFSFQIRNVRGNEWRFSLSFRGTWAADLTGLAQCGESDGTCTFRGADQFGVPMTVTLTYTNAYLWVRPAIWVEVERQGWSIPSLWFSPVR